ncbi:MAG: YceI family protein [Verrucomicrobiota bacterium]
MDARLVCALAVFVTAVCSARAEIHNFEIDPAHTKVQFELRHFAGKVIGRFHDVRGTLRIDPDQPENSSVTASCPTATIETSNTTRDRHLRSELFETEKFPQVQFRSRKVVRTGSEQADLTADLTLHGVTHPIILHVTLLARTKNAEGKEISRWRATGGNFSRRDFGLRWSPAVEAVSMIGDQITLTIECETTASK